MHIHEFDPYASTRSFSIGQRVTPDVARMREHGIRHPPVFGVVVEFVDQYAIKVLVDGKSEPQQYARSLWW